MMRFLLAAAFLAAFLLPGPTRAADKEEEPGLPEVVEPAPPKGPPHREEWVERQWERLKGAPGVRGVVERFRFPPEDPYAELLLTPPFRETYGRSVERYYEALTRPEEGLKLESKQREALDKDLYNYRVKIIRLQADLDASGLGLRQFLKQRPPDFKSARAKLEEFMKTFREMHLAALDAIEKAHVLLTPAQRSKLESVLLDD